MNKNFHFVLVVLFSVNFFTLRVTAAEIGAISGTVKNESGIPIAGATVSDGIRHVFTDNEGKYSIREIPFGYYTLSAVSTEYHTSSQTKISVSNNEEIVVNFIFSLTANPNLPPVISWVGDGNYFLDGLDPESGNGATVFDFRIKYSDADGNNPYRGYPKVHINKAGMEIEGSPFEMTFVSGDNKTGAIYSYKTTLGQMGIDYSYHFEANDSKLSAATGLPLASMDGPLVGNVPNVPRLFFATPSDKAANISWQSPIRDGFLEVEKYKIYRDNVLIGDILANNLSYFDTNLINGKAYAYEISALNLIGEGAKAESVIISPKALPDCSKVQAVKSQTNPKIYLIIDNKKFWLPTPQFFESLGCGWYNISIIGDAELEKMRDYEDSLIMAEGDHKVYLITNGIKRHIVNSEIFLDYGFDWTDVKKVPFWSVEKYKTANLIREGGSGKVYYLNASGTKKWIPTVEIFSSYGYRWEDIQAVSKEEMEAYPESRLIMEEGDYNIYFIENNMKHLVPSIEIFNKHKFDWDQVITVNKKEFGFWIEGSRLR